MTTDPIWQAFAETGDPLYYLLYCAVKPEEKKQARPKTETAG